MRVTSKGQVTIPIEAREKLGILPHTEVEFEVDHGSHAEVGMKTTLVDSNVLLT